MGVCCINRQGQQIQQYNQQKLTKNKSSNTNQHFSNNLQFTGNKRTIAAATQSKQQKFTHFLLCNQIQKMINQILQRQNKMNIKKAGFQGITQKQGKQNENNKDQTSQESNKQTLLQTIDEQKIDMFIEEGNKYIQIINQFFLSEFVSDAKKIMNQILNDQVLNQNNKLVQQFLKQNQTCIKQKKTQELSPIQKLKIDILTIMKIMIAYSYPDLPSLLSRGKVNSKQQIFASHQRKQNPQKAVLSIKNREFFILKIGIKNVVNQLKSQKNKKVPKNKVIKHLGISVFQADKQKQWAEYPMSKQFCLIDIQNMQKSVHNQKLNNPGSSHVDFLITPNTMIRFKTYPYEQTLTLYAPQFLKFVSISQTFQLVRKLQIVNKSIKANNEKDIGPLQNNQSQVCVSLVLQMQIFSSKWLQSIQKMKLQAKNLVHELAIIKKGQDTWQHLNSLKSSFASISQNQSSFTSNLEGSAFCC